jgi:hypothetical protein
MALADRRKSLDFRALAPYPRTPFAFTTTTGVKQAERIGETITGTWEHYPRTSRVDRNLLILEDFANRTCDPESVLRFTQEYGPLDHTFKPDREFRFRIQIWADLQAEFRRRWERLMYIVGKPIPLDVPVLAVKRGEAFEWTFGDLSFRSSTLYRLLTLELHSRPRERLRRCSRPDCPTPYFLAKRLQQRYCCEDCAKWAQREEKLKWWNRVGSKRRQAETKRRPRRP